MRCATSALSKTDQAHQQLYQEGQDLLSDIRFARDVGEVVTDIVQAMPNDKALSDQQWKRIEANTAAQCDAARQMLTAMSNRQHFAITTSTTSATTAVTIEGFSAFLHNPPFQHARQKMVRILDRQPLVDDVRSRLINLRFDQRRESIKSALELLDEAVGGFRRPTSGPSPLSVLFTLRETVLLVIDELLKRRPRQEPARTIQQKLESIGSQCG